MEFLRANWSDILWHIAQHLWLVFVSISIAIVIAVPLGIFITRRKRWRGPVLGIANVMQTIPSLALFGFLIPLPFIGGIGPRTAIVALIFYALLPIIRNTVTGILGVDHNVREAAIAMGMTDRQVLFKVELPLAMSVILTGVRVAVVITIGVAIIAAEVSAGGLGEYIFQGLRMNDQRLLLAGAIPSALMALTADFWFSLLEKSFDRSADTTPTRRRTARVIVGASLAFGAVLLLLFGGLAIGRVLRNRAAHESGRGHVVVGSKDFTESVLLAEIVAQMLETKNVEVERRFDLGGNLSHGALVAGKIDLYPEYTGTSFAEILHHDPITDPRAVYDQVKREYESQFNVEVSAPLGFDNTFAILIRGEEARRLGLKSISPVAQYAKQWQAGFGHDFMIRKDGYKGFSRAYGLQFSDVHDMSLDLTYTALASKKVDLIAGNSTDGRIAALDLAQLEDDRHYFPPYEAVFLTRKDALARVPALAEVMRRLGGAISTEEMRKLNYLVDGEKRDKKNVVHEWLKAKGLI